LGGFEKLLTRQNPPFLWNDENNSKRLARKVCIHNLIVSDKFREVNSEMPNVTVRGAPLTKAKRSRQTLIKTKLQKRQRAARPFD